MMKKLGLGFYDLAGVIAPGMVLVVGGVGLFFPGLRADLLALASVSLGSLGVGLILSYVAGELVQAVGTGIEAAWWRLWGGLPTDWLRSGKHELVAPVQLKLLEARVETMINDESFAFVKVDREQWYSLTRQINAAVAAAKRNARIDTFNGHYGLSRGVAAALLLLLVGTSLTDWRQLKVELVLAVLIGLSVYRMHEFGTVYARELVVQYLQLAPAPDAKRP
jgi:hypothetical protein